MESPAQVHSYDKVLHRTMAVGIPASQNEGIGQDKPYILSCPASNCVGPY